MEINATLYCDLNCRVLYALPHALARGRKIID
jgi:hypothetical protein